MKYKKSLLSLATLGIFAGVGLVSVSNVSAFTDYFKNEDTYNENGNNMYYIDANKVNIECPSGSATYKVDKNYDATKITWFRADETCTNITFDLNGKTVADGAITIPGGVTVTLKDSVGNGYFQNSASHNDAYLDSIVNTQAYGASTASTLIIESGRYQGSFRANGRKLDIRITGGAFDNALSIPMEVTLAIFGGTFSTKPDEKYIDSSFEAYEVDGKFVVDRRFMLTNFFQYMYVGQSSEAYVSPGLVAKTAEVTSSDESILGISCKDSKIIPGQMMIETTDGSIGSKACTITAKKAGKATVSYTTDYGYNGTITVYIADVDTTDYGSAADSAKYELLARYLSVWNAEPVEHSWLTTAPSAIAPDAVEGYKEKYASTAAAIKAGHKIKLTLNFEETTLDDEEKKIIEEIGETNPMDDAKNIAAVYTAAGEIVDVTDKKTLLAQVFGISEFPLPNILKNHNREVYIVGLRKNPNGDYSFSTKLPTTIDNNHIIFSGSYYLNGDKFVILYDGSPINPDGTTDDVPATPNSAGFGEDHSTLLILGASLAGLLAISAPIAYLIHRKKSLDKVRF
ncbi:hypothetical protein IKG73_02300 [Candidatus Saccharibacteria bacterium]|nr:hypothetical protein [Candidatus Saccharibacteria bacterium]